MTKDKKVSEMTPKEIRAEIKSINERKIQPNSGACCGKTEQQEPQPSTESCCESNETGEK